MEFRRKRGVKLSPLIGRSDACAGKGVAGFRGCGLAVICGRQKPLIEPDTVLVR